MATPDPFARMHERLFARLGKEAFLQRQATRAIIERDVAIIGEYGQVAETRTVATLPVDPLPRVGHELVVGSEVWAIDRVLSNDGFTVKAILL